MERTKYINVEGTGLIMFPAGIEHRWITEKFKDSEILGAGFISFGNNTDAGCIGESFSLKIKSTEYDNELLHCLII